MLFRSRVAALTQRYNTIETRQEWWNRFFDIVENKLDPEIMPDGDTFLSSKEDTTHLSAIQLEILYSDARLMYEIEHTLPNDQRLFTDTSEYQKRLNTLKKSPAEHISYIRHRRVFTDNLGPAPLAEQWHRLLRALHTYHTIGVWRINNLPRGLTRLYDSARALYPYHLPPAYVNGFWHYIGHHNNPWAHKHITDIVARDAAFKNRLKNRWHNRPQASQEQAHDEPGILAIPGPGFKRKTTQPAEKRVPVPLHQPEKRARLETDN